MARYRYIFFDFDGTLVDTLPALFLTVNETLTMHGLEPISYKKGQADLFKNVYKNNAKRIDHTLLRKTHLEVQKKYLQQITLYPSAKETLKHLVAQGYILGIISTTNTHKVRRLMELHNLTPYFQAVVTEGDVFNIKPHPEPFMKAFKLLGLSENHKKHSLMVGDTSADILGAQAFGIDSVAYQSGAFETDVRQYNPTYIIHTLSELLPIITAPYEQ